MAMFRLRKTVYKDYFAWLTPAGVLGGAAFLSNPSKYLLSTEAVKDSSLLVWNRPTIRSLAANYPRLLENACALSVETVCLPAYCLANPACSGVCDTARERLAQILIHLAEAIGQKVSGGVEFDVTNEELASAANITPFTASRLLSEWQTNGAVLKRRGKILLRSPERLLLHVV